jgi:hypothetical protein
MGQRLNQRVTAGLPDSEYGLPREGERHRKHGRVRATLGDRERKDDKGVSTRTIEPEVGVSRNVWSRSATCAFANT